MASAQASGEPRRRGRRPGPTSQAKPEPSDESLEKRRQRNRKAQRLFRLRRQAAHANYEKNMVHIEGALEQMAGTFLDFTNGILQSPLIRQDPALVSKLQSATNSILHLCQGGSLEGSPQSNQEINDDIDTFEGRPPSSSTSDDAEFQQTYHGSKEPSQTLDGMLLDFHSLNQPTPVLQPTSQPPPQPTLQPGNIASTARYNPFIKSHSSPIGNIFGNGFMSLPPINFADCATTDYMLHTYPSEESFSIMITRASLQHAYDSILSDTYATSAAVDRIFGFTLKFRSREEILMVLRWYLRPQTSEISRLATAEFDDYLVAQYYHGIATAQYSGIDGVFDGGCLDPSNGRASSPSNQSRILNSYQIEQWLLACGMKYLDFDTIELKEIKPVGRLLNNQPPDTSEELMQPFVALQQTQQQQQHVPLQSVPRIEIQPPADIDSEGKIGNIRLSRSRLIHVLRGISFCIDKGPAYCERAVLESVVIAMHADN
ncbi:uncharacterized protein TrAtP1_007023 [Trichoderma atroviride]|uniref:BZIP domain-containing protein n=1 Tax=Hypocrea atroviridis (strain ATCC 20476 / IMI 206040) TaxID=452589 RepID=G9PCC5_HYPAI|nr:uncharacterized protein TRIATDRAFT_288260 [Trichoderma atroviride IMI 206040]EHK39499.1 hypothetical protein TRIATDRAFT_288260 [Trichoderma atroviride IMI 206040]UKZ65833.1 hypothetical protein TrAtP1_007023 [Trichoderma atroviride]